MNNKWIYEQFTDINVNDACLRDRAVKIAQACAERPEQSFPGRFDNWADIKAAYRFFSHPKVSHQTLQQPHYQVEISPDTKVGRRPGGPSL